MRILLRRVVADLTIVIAANEKGDLKIGTERDFALGMLSNFKLVDNTWYGVDFEFIHISKKEDDWYCNIGTDISLTNVEFPYLFLSMDEAKELERVGC